MGIVNHRYTRKNRVLSGSSSFAVSSSCRGSGAKELLPGGLQSFNTVDMVNRVRGKESSPDLFQNYINPSSGAKPSLCAAKKQIRVHLSINVAELTMKCWTNCSHLI